jgi:hypothetical protein
LQGKTHSADLSHRRPARPVSTRRLPLFRNIGHYLAAATTSQRDGSAQVPAVQRLRRPAREGSVLTHSYGGPESRISMPRIHRASGARGVPSRDRQITLTGFRPVSASGAAFFLWARPAPHRAPCRPASHGTNPSHPENQRPNRSPFRQTSPKTTPRTRGKPKNHTENRPKNR